MLIDKFIESRIRVYAFVGPSGTGKSYRAQMVASEHDIKYIIDTNYSTTTYADTIATYDQDVTLATFDTTDTMGSTFTKWKNVSTDVEYNNSEVITKPNFLNKTFL